MKLIYNLIGLLVLLLGYLLIVAKDNLKFVEQTPNVLENRFTKFPEGSVKVRDVIDGDTIELESGDKVRYIGINTPETVDPRRGVQCFGKEASKRNKELVLGVPVYLEKDISEEDKYGRLLRNVFLDDPRATTSARMVGALLVQEGYAAVSTYPPDIKYKDQLLKLQKEAIDGKIGLWGECNVKLK